ncbi:UNVERIFIED_CONTAM: hypothetical protein K2H54_051919 [Gekko kuhli]
MDLAGLSYRAPGSITRRAAQTEAQGPLAPKCLLPSKLQETTELLLPLTDASTGQAGVQDLCVKEIINSKVEMAIAIKVTAVKEMLSLEVQVIRKLKGIEDQRFSIEVIWLLDTEVKELADVES